MTKRLFSVRYLSVVAIPLLTLGSLVGCQTASTTTMAYPAPSFNAPRMVAQQPAPMLAMANNYPMPAPRVAPTPSPAVHSAPMVAPMAGIPITWVPPVAPRPWRGIVIHHSATTTGGAAAFDKMHRAKGWDELGYDFVIGNGSDTGNGQVEVGSRWVKQKIGAHAKSSDNRFNEYYIGICLVGNFDVERPTPQQMAAVDRLVAYLMVTYHIRPDQIIGHNDTKQTDCPGKYLNVAVIRREAAQLAGSRMYQAKSTTRSELLTDVSGTR